VQLSAAQQLVVDHRGSHLQVIACAGSGKTESISRRVAALVAEGNPPESIVAFTFTERAAAELKERILARVVDRLGEQAKGPLARMYVGTIHGYCFRLLQDHVPRYGNYDVLDDHKHAGLLAREHRRLGLQALGDGKWRSIRDFSATVDVLGNELVPADALGDTPLGNAYRSYLDTLDRYHYLTFGLIIQKAVESLRDPKVLAAVHGPLRHLIVDEYQDVNPAQEALIRLLGAAPVQVCVVGDDDQAIYQWRGSDVANIQRFGQTFRGAKSLTLDANRRSRLPIVEAANRFTATITPRLPKEMKAEREQHPDAVVPWSASTPEHEVETIADTIVRLRALGHRYRDIAVLYRSVRTSAPDLIQALRARGIPFSCGGRTGLFLQPEVEAFGRIYVWLAGWEWRPPGYGQQPVQDTPETLARALRAAFEGAPSETELQGLLTDWAQLVPTSNRPVNLIRDYYEALRMLGVTAWNLDDPVQSARAGALGRFSGLLADYENATRRGRWVEEEGGQQVFRGGQDRGRWYYEGLANFLLHYARDAYEDFAGEDSPDLDAVDIVTVHQAKGLEWPVVFLPALVDQRFPSKRTGQEQEWLLPGSILTPAMRRRYEGTEEDERRLFYVAMTRARDTLYVSHFRAQKRAAKPSRFLADLFGAGPLPERASLPTPTPLPPKKPDEAPKIAVSFSELSDFDDCGHRYRLRESFGFETQLVSELGYGRAIHHVLRHIAEAARATGKVPSALDIECLLDAEFYLPFANAAGFPQMRKMASRLVQKYVTAWREDLSRIWATERPFELHLADGTLTGRADVILDRHDGQPDALALVDYKTVKGNDLDAAFGFQLAVYAAAGRAEGLDVQAAYLHHLEEGARSPVDIGSAAVQGAVQKVHGLVRQLRARTFVPKPDAKKCKSCEQRRLCPHAPRDPYDD
jgi:DNA helicase-2/ATP-dependent DNA helicase PcrA